MTVEDFLSEYGIRLNGQQRKAVETVEGPALLLAVPGSGKTTVLITRLGYMIFGAGILPEQILTVTYTVAAARDMGERFGRLFGEEMQSRLAFRTINGICDTILRRYGQMTGRQLFPLAEDREVAAAVNAAYQEVSGDYATESDRRQIASQITYIKNGMLTQEEIKALDITSGYPMSRIYPIYCRLLREKGRIDYDDQLVYAHRLLENRPQLLEYFQDRFLYLCVDEAQDTSRIQHEILALLAGKRDNLFLVGDEDQSIYGFRAAYPRALLDFEKNHPGARVLLMEENFRSDAAIVAAADRLIRSNTERHMKQMKASRPEETPIRRITIRSRREQYPLLAREAENPVRQTAVLYREHESVLPLLDLLDRSGIPYRMRGTDMVFFSSRVVLDLVRFLRFSLHPDDPELFLQLYYKMGLYMKKEDARKYCRLAGVRQIPILETAAGEGGLPPFQAENLRNKAALLRRIPRMAPEQAIIAIVDDLEYGEYLRKQNNGGEQVYLLRCLAAREQTIEGFLARLGELQQIAARHRDDPDCPFILSTIHASKGLEYDRVFLLDALDGIFPEDAAEAEFLKKAAAGKQKLDPNQQQELEACEEERRIFYVAVTRARQELILLEEPGKNLFIRELMGETKTSGRRQASSAAAYQAFVNALGDGVLVEHARFGKGVVVSMTPTTVTVDFDGETRKLGLQILFEKHLLELL